MQLAGRGITCVKRVHNFKPTFVKQHSCTSLFYYINRPSLRFYSSFDDINNVVPSSSMVIGNTQQQNPLLLARIEYWTKLLHSSGVDPAFHAVRKDSNVMGMIPSVNFVCTMIEACTDMFKAERIFYWFMELLRSRERDVDPLLEQVFASLITLALKPTPDEFTTSQNLLRMGDLLRQYTLRSPKIHVSDRTYSNIVKSLIERKEGKLISEVIDCWASQSPLILETPEFEEILNKLCEKYDNVWRKWSVLAALESIHLILRKTNRNLKLNIAELLIDALSARASDAVVHFILEYTIEKSLQIQTDLILRYLNQILAKEVLLLLDKNSRSAYVNHQLLIYDTLCKNFLNVEELKDGLTLFINVYNHLGDKSAAISLYKRLYAITRKEEGTQEVYTLLEALVNSGSLEKAYSIFRGAKWKDSRPYWLMVSGYVVNSDLERAMEVLKELWICYPTGVLQRDASASKIFAQLLTLIVNRCCTASLGKVSDYISPGGLHFSDDLLLLIYQCDFPLYYSFESYLAAPPVNPLDLARLRIVLQLHELTSFDYTSPYSTVIHVSVMKACTNLRRPLDALKVFASMLRPQERLPTDISALVTLIKENSSSERAWLTNTAYVAMFEAILAYHAKDPLTGIKVFMDLFQCLVEKRVWAPTDALFNLVQSFMNTTLAAEEHALARQKVLYSVRYSVLANKFA